MSIPAEEYVHGIALCEQAGQLLLKLQAYIRKGPPKFSMSVEPNVRLATGVLRSDKISHLARAVRELAAACEAAEQLDDVHYEPRWEAPSQQKLTSRPIRTHIYDEWPPIEKKGRPG